MRSLNVSKNKFNLNKKYQRFIMLVFFIQSLTIDYCFMIFQTGAEGIRKSNKTL